MEQHHEVLPFIDQILTVLSIPQLAIRYMSEGWKSYNNENKVSINSLSNHFLASQSSLQNNETVDFFKKD